jgi:hypothetical protein
MLPLRGPVIEAYAAGGTARRRGELRGSDPETQSPGYRRVWQQGWDDEDERLEEQKDDAYR